jgi:hypothetical protein
MCLLHWPLLSGNVKASPGSFSTTFLHYVSWVISESFDHAQLKEIQEIDLP